VAKGLGRLELESATRQPYQIHGRWYRICPLSWATSSRRLYTQWLTGDIGERKRLRAALHGDASQAAGHLEKVVKQSIQHAEERSLAVPHSLTMHLRGQ
jgi:hypothetical protein